MATIENPQDEPRDDDNYDNRDQQGGYEEPGQGPLDPQDRRPEGEYYGNYGNRDQYRGDDYPRPDYPRPQGGCGESQSPTDKTIRPERTKLCEELKDKAGEVRQWEQSRLGAHQLYYDKKCSFNRTETNYQYYRNLELAVGVELLQMNEGIKENVTSYKKWNDELAGVLKELVKATREAKAKFADLKKAACDLNTCINDSCQATQRKILTGESYDNCREGEMAEKCNAMEVLERLDREPNIFFNEIDVIFNSATRVAGIQAFSNVGTLEPLQKTMQEKSKAFDDFILEKMKAGGDDLKKNQEELTKSIQELTKATSTLYFKRSDFKGVFRATRQLCDCDCGCISDGEEGRLDLCKCYICNICDQVQAGVCNAVENPGYRTVPGREETQSFTY